MNHFAAGHCMAPDGFRTLDLALPTGLLITAGISGHFLSPVFSQKP